MKESTSIPQYDASHYAVVDLGSNSFHLLIIRLQENQLIPINKVKRNLNQSTTIQYTIAQSA